MKWFRLIFLIPLLVFFVFTNIYEDPANIFHNESKEIAETIIKGNAAYSATGNGNEREVKKYLIMNMPDEVDCVAVGPSLIMCVGQEIVGSESFYNLGVSGGDMYDILAQFALLDIYGKKVNRVIICVDSYFFDDDLNSEENDRNMQLMDYSKYMLDILHNNEIHEIEEDKLSTKTVVEQAFSVSYFQASWNQVLLNKTYQMDDMRWGIVDEDFDGMKPYYCSDGSWVYAKSFQMNDLNYVLDDCNTYNIKTQFAYDKHISEYSKDVFESLIVYLKNEGVEVEFYFCPLAPRLWDRVELEKEHYAILDEITFFANDISKKYECKITGSYNPYELKITDEDFYDARHVRREKLAEYFDFTGY